MFDIRLIRTEPDRVKEAMDRRRAGVDIDAVLDTDAKRRTAIYDMEQLRARQNRAGESIAARKRSGENADDVIAEMKSIKESITVLEEQSRALDEALQQQLLILPNIPDSTVPEGANDGSNREERTWGVLPVFDFAPKDHVDIAESLGIIDFERATKLSGARFTLNMGVGALLERALINFMLDLHTREHGYTEVWPPLLVNSDSMKGTGQLPKFSEDLFKVEKS
ncbi:MAG TPA: serine--tRNA ligase, partial [Candidatus Hydrogenedentes bacterium]|nr:serine--tRNA ligase [Candidatus Hydrogenedentota bacterium]